MDSDSTTQDEKCASPRHTECALFQEKGGTAGSICPYREDRLVQYCSAVGVPRYVPYSSGASSLCGAEAFRFCETYRAIAGKGAGVEEVAEGVTVLEHLHYAPNHLWLSVGENGLCHIGVDALLARFLGTLERVTFLTLRGVQRPAAVLSVHGVDWRVVFPSPLLLESADLHLRADPSRITEDPYGAGWLFDAWIAPGTTREQLCAELVQGRRAVAWMKQEVARLTSRVSECLQPAAGGLPVATDGGSLAGGAAGLLSRDHLLGVLNEFFSAQSGWTKER